MTTPQHLDDVARTYIRLAHGIEAHLPGYIDGYYGPDALRETEQRPLDVLEREIEQLHRQANDVLHEPRCAFLSAQTRAMRTSVRLLKGESIPYREEVRDLYDIEAERTDERVFDEMIASIEGLLPGSGDVASREQAFRAQLEIPPERLRPLFDIIVRELRQRTADTFGLPAGESFDVAFVTDQPWSGYNWYLGKNRSRIDINTDLPKYLTDLPDLIAHEAYPGHHTEHAIKDAELYEGKGHGEHCILLINAPECVISEGIATRARQAVMTDDELRDWLISELGPSAGIPADTITGMLDLQELKRGMRYVTNNAALMLHEDGASEADVKAYIQRYRLARPEEADKSLQFITHPNFRSYIFTYTAGGELLDRLFAKGDARRWFSKLLHEPVTPGLIRDWIAE